MEWDSKAHIAGFSPVGTFCACHRQGSLKLWQKQRLFLQLLVKTADFSDAER